MNRFITGSTEISSFLSTDISSCTKLIKLFLTNIHRVLMLYTPCEPVRNWFDANQRLYIDHYIVQLPFKI